MGHWTQPLIALILMKIAITTAAAVVASQALPDCDEWCGDMQIPYPFGVRKGCYLNETFLVTCNKTTNPPKAFLKDTNISVTNISISGELHMMQPIVRDCYKHVDGPLLPNEANLTVPAAFPIAYERNKFIAIGCNTFGLIGGVVDGSAYVSGCVSMCTNDSKKADGACVGNGCCQLEIPRGLSDLILSVGSLLNHTDAMDFNPCGYAFVVGDEGFQFSTNYITSFDDVEVEVVSGWAIGNDTNFVCGLNSVRNSSFSDDGSEFRCECFDGFEGNPYLPRGCQDIDECKDERLNNCKYKNKCINTIGNYTCDCPKNFKGDGRHGGEGCIRDVKAFTPIIIGIGVGFTVLVMGITWVVLGYKKWKFIKRKEKFFKENGGFILQRQLSQWQSANEMVRIFTQEELEKATNNYNDTTIVGKGGYGTVYKGILHDGLAVAIKKSKLVDQSQTDQFINELIVLSQINHRNVVRLLGCCLETQVPLLVYEFVTNGTLFDRIHDKANHVSLSWETRLKIASETAGVLSYLHSSTSTPIIHRDIKTTNILLDDNYTAKVSDFGASKLVPMDQTQLSTMVQGTLGYLDPEYLLTSELTEKSDVYSFGIVVLELITGKKAVSFDGPEAERNLAMYVLCAMKEDRLEEIVERRMVREANFEQIREATKLATKCVRIKGEERPCMKEVAMELEGLRLMQGEHSWVNMNLSNADEMICLLDHVASDPSHFVESTSLNNSVGDSLKARILSHIHHGR
ncbi:wall-associated receptor kinase 2-like isoform X1 [Cucurbita moschata]|uniref:Wall-associated receptor kinase 2-like isoform X1 n=1 Tax=Cucurbita moschata TaxID=3662 RepID=A0A6J1FMZ5_CUCMO|nr:wall-associated receptor kinase 2-like isoform X1 [Cucurbita moschata]